MCKAISLGYSSSTGALFGAIYNVASGIGRIGFGVFADILVGVRPTLHLAPSQLIDGYFCGWQNLTSWIVALSAVAVSSLCVWPFAYGKGVIALYVPPPSPNPILPSSAHLRPPLRYLHRFAVLAGMGSGGYFSLQSSIVAQIVGSHRVGAAIGAIELVSSIGASVLYPASRRWVADACW